MTVAPQPALKIGIHLPEVERIAPWSDLAAMARATEDCGFDSLWVPDHLLYRFEGVEPHGPWECWSILAAIAAVTTRVELGTLVIATGFRNPALTAKIADTVDEISGGRLILGVGAGWHQPEYDAFGFPFDQRVSRFEEALTIIHTLLRSGQIDFEGRYYTARECELRPRGPRPAGPPLLMGTTRPRMLRLCAQYCEYWNVWSRNSAAAIPEVRALVDAACLDVGRDPATLQRTVAVHVDLPGFPRDTPPSDMSGASHLSGSIEAIGLELRRYADEGIGHIQVVLNPNTVAGIEAFAPVLDIVRQ